MYGRAWWQVAFVRTCHVHEHALTVLRTAQGVVIHDFAALVRRHASNMVRLAAEAEPRQATGLEGYLVQRLSGQVGGVPLLDGLQVGLAARFCEVLGTVRLHGRARRSGRLDGEGLRIAGHAEFALAAAGDEGVRSFVAGMLDPGSEGRRANGGVQSALGPLHDWLADNRRSSGQDGLRDLVREVVAANMPLGADNVCLWEAVGTRKLHSIRSASRETRVHPKRLRKVLHEAGIIGDDHIGRPDNLVTFPADTSAEFLSRLRGTMPLAKVAKYIDADRVHAKLLLDADFLIPVYPRQEGGKRILAFNRSDADDFLAWLGDRAEVFEEERDGAFSIPRAAKRVPCGAMDIVRLIRDKRLPWVGRLSDKSGYLGIRVRPDQVRPLIFPDIGISVREASKRLGLPVGITRNLQNFGLLRT